jgi:N4-gp56 family major capsid protein
MPVTNFAAQTTNAKTVWAKQFWAMARNMSFVGRFMGEGANSMIQRITELTKTEKGARAVITLIGDMTGDGVTGDNALEGNEEALTQYDVVIRIDQLRNGNLLAGRLADQKSVVNFRTTSRDQLAYWASDRIDQLAFLTLSGMQYTLKNNGALRPVNPAGRNLSNLEFAADVTPPTAMRHRRFVQSSGTLAAGNTALITAADTLSYRALVLMKAFAKEQYIRGIKSSGGEEVYHVFVTPAAMARLKLDPDYLANVRGAGPRDKSNSLFAGTTSVMVDGLIIHEFRHVFNTSGLGPTAKWGAGGAIDGCRVLLCGAQALAMADLGDASWEEKSFDYGNQQGITIGKIFGLLKPRLFSNVTGDVQDFGVVALDVAQ